MDYRYLTLADFLLIAEEVTGTSAATLARIPHLVQRASSALAAPAAGFGGEELYSDAVQKAAILCSRLVRNHPLVDGNKRVAYLCLVEALERNGYSWPYEASAEDEDEIVETIVCLASSELSESEFMEWVQQRVRAS